MSLILSARANIGSRLVRTPRCGTRHAIIALATLTLSSFALAKDVDYEMTDFRTTQVDANLYVLRGSPNTDPGHRDGAGGRVSVLVGADWVLMVDTSYAALHDKLKAQIRAITHAPVRFIINTHAHPDHTGGNAAFVREGAIVLAREEAREALEVIPSAAVVKANRNHIDFLDPQRLPVITYRSGSTLSLHLDDEIVDIIPLPSAHTNGDTAVRFERANVITIGDVYRNYGYPFVDEAQGGSIQGMLDAIDLLLHTAGPDTVLVPGHGELIRRADLVTYRDMILDVRERVRSMTEAGQTREEIIAARPTSPYDEKVAGARSQLPAGFGISADRFVGSLYDELEHGPPPLGRLDALCAKEIEMQEPVRDVYRSFEILLILRHIEFGSIETTLFINPTASTTPALAQAAKQLGGSVLHAPDAATPITDQIEAAHRVVDELIARHQQPGSR